MAGSFLGGALVILGLVLLKDAAAPLAEQPWFREMLEGTGDSLALAFLVAALLTFIVQSSSAVTVFGISLAAIGLLSVEQAIMIMYGSLAGSGAILYLLSAGLATEVCQPRFDVPTGDDHEDPVSILSPWNTFAFALGF